MCARPWSVYACVCQGGPCDLIDWVGKSRVRMCIHRALQRTPPDLGMSGPLI